MDHMVCHMDNTPPRTASAALGSQVRESLRIAGVSVPAAAERTGVPLTTLKRRLRGQDPFRITELAALAELTGTTASELLRRTEASVS